jgi:hypothetical protein
MLQNAYKLEAKVISITAPQPNHARYTHEVITIELFGVSGSLVAIPLEWLWRTTTC